MKNHFQQLTEIFDLDGRTTDLPARLNREVNDLTELHTRLKKEEDAARSSSRNTFYVLGAALAAIAVAMPFAWLLPFGNIEVLLTIAGGVGMAFGVSKVMRTISRDPAGRLRDRMDSMYVRMLKDMKRGESHKLRQLRRQDRVIGGVAGALAQRLDLPPTLVRFGFVAATFISSGFFIPLYFIAAMILHHSRERQP